MNYLNGLTPAEAERLTMLIEECGEVIQAATKCLRHGYDSTHPDGGENNRGYLRREIKDVLVVFQAICGGGEMDDIAGVELRGIWKKKLHYTHHQGD